MLCYRSQVICCYWSQLVYLAFQVTTHLVLYYRSQVIGCYWSQLILCCITDHKSSAVTGHNSSCVVLQITNHLLLLVTTCLSCVTGYTELILRCTYRCIIDHTSSAVTGHNSFIFRYKLQPILCCITAGSQVICCY